ncbi:hypothetical protein ANTPLA_LOCUS9953 [Anthophora plagiata]
MHEDRGPDVVHGDIFIGDWLPRKRAIKERERWFSRDPRISEQDPFDLAHTPPIDQAEPLGRTKPPCHGLTINLQPAE